MLKKLSVLGLLAFTHGGHAAPANHIDEEVIAQYDPGIRVYNPLTDSTPSGSGLLAEPLGSSRTNILLIIADDLGSDKVTAYQGDISGYMPAHIPQTTTIDGLASAGLRFTDAWANPVCSPTRAGLFTGGPLFLVISGQRTFS